MGHARHIGRVGALAVALGIGVGTFWSPGVALADPSESDGSSSSSSSPGTGSGAGAGADTDRDGPGDAGSAVSNVKKPHEPSTSTTRDDTTATTGQHHDDTDSPTKDAADETSTTPAEEDDDLDESASPSDTGDSQHTVPEVPPTPTPTPIPTPTPTSPAIHETSQPGNKNAGTTTPPPADDSSPPTSARADTHQSRQVAPPRAETNYDAAAAPLGAAPATASRQTTLSLNVIQPAVAPPTNPLAELVAIPARVVTAVVAALLSPFLAPATPATPAPATLWTVLAWVRQELHRTFFNRAPRLAAAPTDVEQVDDVVTGTLLGSDPDGDPVTYSVTPTTAKGGTVTIDGAGNFTYVASDAWSGVGTLTDTFTVSAADTGFHVHGLLGLLFGGGHATTREVTVQLVGGLAGVAETIPVAVPPEWATPRVTVGSGGTVVVTQQFGTGTAADPFTAQILVQGPGRPPVITSATGYVGVRPLIADDGTAYVTTLIFPAGSFTATGTVVTMLQPGKEPASWTTGRLVQGPQLTSAGDYVLTTATGGGAPTDTQTTVVLISDGQKRDALSIAGSTDSPATIGGNGTIALTVTNASGGTTIGVLRPGSQPEYLDVPGTVEGPATVADDGTVIFTTSGTTGLAARTVAAAAAVTPTLWVWRPGATAVSIATDDTIDSLVTGGRGTVAYVTSTGSGSDVDPVITTVTMLRPGSPAMVSTTTGQLVGLVVGADGTVAYTTYAGAAFLTTPMTLTFLRPDGSEGTATFATSNQFRYRPTVGADGTVAAMWVDDDGTKVAVFRPGQAMITETSPDPISHAPEVGADGTVAFVVSIGAGTAQQFSQVFVMRPGMQTSVASIYGNSQGLTVTGDGTVVHSSRVDKTLSYVMVMRPNGDGDRAGARFDQQPRRGRTGRRRLPADRRGERWRERDDRGPVESLRDRQPPRTCLRLLDRLNRRRNGFRHRDHRRGGQYGVHDPSRNRGIRLTP